eukprot:11394187-Alexandrium_andersonii.AAC.1
MFRGWRGRLCRFAGSNCGGLSRWTRSLASFADPRTGRMRMSLGRGEATSILKTLSQQRVCAHKSHVPR